MNKMTCSMLFSESFAVLASGSGEGAVEGDSKVSKTPAGAIQRHMVENVVYREGKGEGRVFGLDGWPLWEQMF